jgi:hypothetical protein
MSNADATSLALRLSDPDPRARQVALTELWESLDSDALGPLLGSLHDPDAVVRRLVAAVGLPDRHDALPDPAGSADVAVRRES